jgi:RNA polymerase sigma-70 factor (ECF subfamily)
MDESGSLIARVRDGDKAAFRLIFERHHRLVLRFLYGMVGEHGLAEELTQETFMRAYRNIHSLRDEAMLDVALRHRQECREQRAPLTPQRSSHN